MTTAPRSARGHRRTHPSGKTRRRGPKRRTAHHTETDTEPADVLHGLQRVIIGQRAASGRKISVKIRLRISRVTLLERRGTAAAGPGNASQQLTGLWIRPADRRAAPAAPAFRLAGSQSRELQADSCAASRRRRTPSGGTPAERHTITAERGRALKERRGSSRERRGAASERRRDTRERRGAATDGRRSNRERRGAASERCSETREQLGEPPEGRRPPS